MTHGCLDELITNGIKSKQHTKKMFIPQIKLNLSMLYLDSMTLTYTDYKT